MEILFIQMMHKSQFHKINPCDWFCAPGSQLPNDWFDLEMITDLDIIDMLKNKC